ncbi:hypothetical protein Mapa_003348 [Marchantia paleacea]|nr:hypothetical protein Mapa_003348 [Marchantia paleacea]
MNCILNGANLFLDRSWIGKHSQDQNTRNTMRMSFPAGIQNFSLPCLPCVLGSSQL